MKTRCQAYSSQKSTECMHTLSHFLFLIFFFFKQPEYQVSGPKIKKSAKSPSIIQDMKYSTTTTQADTLQTPNQNLPMIAVAKPKQLSYTCISLQ